MANVEDVDVAEEEEWEEEEDEVVPKGIAELVSHAALTVFTCHG
jgi:hypothetical protein